MRGPWHLSNEGHSVKEEPTRHARHRDRVRSTEIFATTVDVDRIYASFRARFGGLRSFAEVQDLAGRRRLLKELSSRDVPDALIDAGPVFHYDPDPDWRPAFERDRDGSPLRLLNTPDRRVVTLFYSERAIDLSAVPEYFAAEARRDPVRQAELQNMYCHDRVIRMPGQRAQIYGYYPADNDQVRRFLSGMTSAIRRPMTNHYRLQDVITGESLGERSGVMLWAGEDVQRRCSEECDFFATIDWSTEQQRWIGWKTLPREPRRRRTAAAP